jgi:3-methyladenine DNA glycosylase AlkD
MEIHNTEYPVITRLRQELLRRGTEENRRSGQRFFKEEVNMYGIRSHEVTLIGREYFGLLPNPVKNEVFSICEELWKSRMLEEGFIACHWAFNMKKNYETADINLFERWVGEYVTNWATCDTLCNHTVGEFIMKFPDNLKRLKDWTVSPNRWMRRAAAVSMIIPARNGLFLPDILEIAELMLSDSDDMVQKGYGWMLKAASEPYCQDVFRFVMLNKLQMPRTALRYAIEKMPNELKKQAMLK